VSVLPAMTVVHIHSLGMNVVARSWIFDGGYSAPLESSLRMQYIA